MRAAHHTLTARPSLSEAGESLPDHAPSFPFLLLQSPLLSLSSRVSLSFMFAPTVNMAEVKSVFTTEGKLPFILILEKIIALK